MQPPLELFSFPDSLPLATSVAEQLGSEVIPIDTHRFPDGESLIRAESRRPGQAVIFRSLDRPNDKLIEILFAADSLRRQGVVDLTLFAPYLGYMRQDRIFHPGEPISQHVVGRLLGNAFDQVFTVEAHLHRIHDLAEVFPCRAKSFSAASPIASWLRSHDRSGLLIGPDSESEPWIRSIAEQSDLEWVVASKVRDSDQKVRIDLPPLPSSDSLSTTLREAWIVDDIASSGATLETLVRILKKRGFERVGAIVVHALMDEATPQRLAAAGLDSLISTDSIPDPSNGISLASLIAEALSKSQLASGDL